MDAKKIIDYEKRLMQLRIELDELSLQSKDDSEARLSDKMNFLSVELMHLNKQMEFLKQEMTPQPVQKAVAETVAKPVAETVAKPAAETVVKPAPETLAKPAAESVAKPVAETVAKPAPETVAKPAAKPEAKPAPEKKKDYEGTIGKAWMAIIASVLVFISLAMFAAVFIPNLSDVAKMVLMFVFSFGLTGVSLGLLLGKDRDSKLFLALTGCGVGSVYISLLLCGLVFGVLSQNLLYILLFLWSVGVCILLRLKSILFTIIGQIGVTMAVIIGCVYCGIELQREAVIAVFIFFVLSQTAFLISTHSRSFVNNMGSHIGILIGGCSIIIANSLPGMNISFIAALMLGLLMLYYTCSFILMDDGKNVVSHGIMYIPYVMLVFLAENRLKYCLFEKTDAFLPATQVLVAVMLVTSFLKKKKEKLSFANEVLIKTGSAFALLTAAAAMKDLGLYMFVYAAVFYILAVVEKDKLNHWIGLFFTMTATLCLESMALYMAIPALIIVMALQTVSMLSDYNVIKKMFAQLSLYAVIAAFVTQSLSLKTQNETGLIFCLFAVINIIMTFCGTKNLKTQEKEEFYDIFTKVVNAILLVVSVPVMFSVEIWHIPVILITLALVCLNLLSQVKSGNALLNVYAALKTSIYIAVVLASFDAKGFYISAALLVFAIICIIVGYAIDRKAIRIYGLVIANVSVIKLILIDISYQNTLGHALSFLGCGALCFIISLIYTVIEKKDAKKNNCGNI